MWRTGPQLTEKSQALLLGKRKYVLQPMALHFQREMEEAHAGRNGDLAGRIVLLDQHEAFMVGRRAHVTAANCPAVFARMRLSLASVAARRASHLFGIMEQVPQGAPAP